MKNLIKILIHLLELLQNFPYDKTITSLRTLLFTEDKTETPPNQSRKLEINFKDGAIFIDNSEIISKKAENLQKIFKILLKQFLQDSMKGEDIDKFNLLSIHKFSEILEIAGETILDKEKQVRRPINRLQRALFIKFGVNIIETVRCSYIGNPFGYRLNPSIICLGAKNTRCKCCMSEKNSLMS